MADLNKKSKFLSYVLRHRPYDFGLSPTEGGWVPVNQLLKAIDFTQEELDTIVSTDKKGRYSYDDKGNIRANQGHSINVDMQFVELEPPEFLHHGTGRKSAEIIIKDGIMKMNRQYVHLSIDAETACTVGRRYGKPVLIQIRAKQMYDDGCKFFRSDNGVWLTDYVDPKYFRHVAW